MSITKESNSSSEDFYNVFGFADGDALNAHIGSIWAKVDFETFLADYLEKYPVDHEHGADAIIEWHSGINSANINPAHKEEWDQLNESVIGVCERYRLGPARK